MAGESSVKSKTDRFSSLPVELRLKIFAYAYADLVFRLPHTGGNQGLFIYEGKLFQPKHILQSHVDFAGRFKPDFCYDTAAKLLSSFDDPLYPEMIEPFFSQNRFIFAGSPTRSLAFLRAHSKGLDHIRELRFQFHWLEIENLTFQEDLWDNWEELIAFVGHNFNLSKLILSLDARSRLDPYDRKMKDEPDEGDYRLEVYERIIEPLRGLAKSGLKRFYVYWGCHHWYETEAEKWVMGKYYAAEDKPRLGNITYLNPFYTPYTGYDPEEISLWSLIQPQQS